MATASFFNELMQTLGDRGRALIGRSREAIAQGDLVALGELLLSRRGEASGVALAGTLLDTYAAAPLAARLSFLTALADRFGPDRPKLETAIDAYRGDPGPVTINALHEAAEARRQELIRRLNLAPGGTSALVHMREELLAHLPARPDLQAVDNDFTHLFSSWFNRGFLVLRPIDWTTPANILEKIIRYEAVHAINDWIDLRNRLQPP
ncbi:MAG TPA: malonyl-CoA decarboxylase N-terminal domain-containing protein, partial [Beijerinckiaceae bacterium]|nr:malonyl-CoA decarboxylase N-terminal domain-containing protein [Beijerinckiaceae bacterium]